MSTVDIDNQLRHFFLLGLCVWTHYTDQQITLGNHHWLFDLGDYKCLQVIEMSLKSRLTAGQNLANVNWINVNYLKEDNCGLGWPYDPVIPLLGIHLKKTIINKTCTPVFIATIFIRIRTWKQTKCPSRNEWIKIWYIIYNGNWNIA